MFVYILNAMWKYFNAHLFVTLTAVLACSVWMCVHFCEWFVVSASYSLIFLCVCVCVHLFVLQFLRIWMHWNNVHLISKFVCRRNVQHLHIIVRRLQIIERKIQNKIWKTVEEDLQRKQQYYKRYDEQIIMERVLRHTPNQIIRTWFKVIGWYAFVFFSLIQTHSSFALSGVFCSFASSLDNWSCIDIKYPTIRIMENSSKKSE